MKLPKPLQDLVDQLKKMPGVGLKTAERYAFHLLEWPEESLTSFSLSLSTLKKRLFDCQECGALYEEKCPFCSDLTREKNKLCLVACFKDAMSIESTGEFYGGYHVTQGLLSPLEKKGPEKLRLRELKDRIVRDRVEEILLAFEATLEGDVTALFIKRELSSLSLDFPLEIHRPAMGLPMGSSLNWIDVGTLARAIKGKSTMS